MSEEEKIASTREPIKVTLTDEDIEKLAAAIVTKSAEQFQLNVGKAVMEYLWKTFIAGLIVYLAWPKKD